LDSTSRKKEILTKEKERKISLSIVISINGDSKKAFKYACGFLEVDSKGLSVCVV